MEALAVEDPVPARRCSVGTEAALRRQPSAQAPQGRRPVGRRGRPPSLQPRPRLAAAAAALVAAALVLAGCFGLIRTNPHHLVLAPADLPAGFVRTAAAPYTNADVATAFHTSLSTVTNTLGRRDGYRAVYTAGDRVVVSVVSLYAGAVPAQKALALEIRINRQVHPALTSVSVPTLGSQTRAFSGKAQDPKTKKPLVVVSIYWRQNNAIAAVTLTGRPGSVSTAEAVRLAQAQERRLKSAL